MTTTCEESFWAFCLERDRIYLRRAAGMAEPWTCDPLLARCHFTNVHRDRDPGTAWISRLGGLSGPDLLFSIWFYRSINRMETFEDIGFPVRTAESVALWEAAAAERSRIRGLPIGSSRHFTEWPRVIKNAAWWFGPEPVEMWDGMPASLYDVVRTVRKIKSVGPFTAVQIAGDLVELGIREDGITPYGPGSNHALQILMLDDARFEYTDSRGGFTRNYLYDEEAVFLHALVARQPRELSKPMRYIDVEHALCEWSRWLRWTTEEKSNGGLRRPR